MRREDTITGTLTDRLHSGKHLARRVLAMLAAAVLALTALTGCQSDETKLPAGFDKKTVKEDCMKVIDDFNARNYQAIWDMGDETLKNSVPVGEFSKQCDPQLDKCGKFEKIEKSVVLGSVDKKTKAKYGGAVMVGKYEKGKIQFTIGFNEKMELVQFLIK